MIVEGIAKYVYITNHFPVSWVLLCITMPLLTGYKSVYMAQSKRKKKKQITLNSISKQKHLENMSLKITMTDLQCSFFLCSLPILNEISFVCLY